MATNTIRINTDTLASEADAFAQNLNYIERCVTALENDYEALNSMWDGTANHIYSLAFRQDIENIRTYIEKLREINVFENTAKDQYNNCENEVNSYIASLTV